MVRKHPRYRHTAVDDVDGQPVSELAARGAVWLSRDKCDEVVVTITPADPDCDIAHHWLTPLAAAHLARYLTSVIRPEVFDLIDHPERR